MTTTLPQRGQYNNNHTSNTKAHTNAHKATTTRARGEQKKREQQTITPTTTRAQTPQNNKPARQV